MVRYLKTYGCSSIYFALATPITLDYNPPVFYSLSL
jgi:hypothetical protein